MSSSSRFDSLMYRESPHRSVYEDGDSYRGIVSDIVKRVMHNYSMVVLSPDTRAHVCKELARELDTYLSYPYPYQPDVTFRVAYPTWGQDDSDMATMGIDITMRWMHGVWSVTDDKSGETYTSKPAEYTRRDWHIQTPFRIYPSMDATLNEVLNWRWMEQYLCRDLLGDVAYAHITGSYAMVRFHDLRYFEDIVGVSFTEADLYNYLDVPAAVLLNLGMKNMLLAFNYVDSLERKHIGVIVHDHATSGNIFVPDTAFTILDYPARKEAFEPDL